ncbi:MAG: hypothetical protein OXE17_00810 [Chloroflexi bacterium]|nr:hypothetical protein [Chloroflexota bacterium]
MICLAVEQIKGALSFGSMDESATKQGVVLRLLSVAGWDTFDTSQVVPEYTVGNRRVDYALRPGTPNAVFIEVKRPGENLERHQQQLLEYCFQEGVNLAVLTNGRTWWLYLPLQAGSWEQRRFLTIDLDDQEPGIVKHRFLEYLAPERVDSGQAVRDAEALVESQQRTETMGKTIVAAWNQIVETPDELLVDLISETTERMCGFKPEPDLVEQFLAQRIQKLFDSPPEQERLPRRGQPTTAPIGPTSTPTRQVPGGMREGPLPISLDPPRPGDFLEALLEAGHAWLEVSYNDGQKEVRRWNAPRMSSTSNVIGNLRSRAEFRAGKWQAMGIASLRVTIERPNDG